MRFLVCFFLLFASFGLNAKEVQKKAFKTFTGKVLGNKVRVRTSPDLEGHIIAELGKNDLLLVTGESGDFWACKPLENTKAYVYRTYILDNTVEANRVNIRLEPSAESPIIGQLQLGDKIAGEISKKNTKWYEITPPDSVQFYISKEYIGFAGGPDYIKGVAKQKEEAEQELRAIGELLTNEMTKPFAEMNPDKVIKSYEELIQTYKGLDDIVAKAKKGLSNLEANYTKKKIAYLEKKADGTKVEEIVFPKYSEKKQVIRSKNPAAKNLLWEEVEDSLYQNWLSYNRGKKAEDFYNEQKVNAIKIHGKVESYDYMINNKPGDHLLKLENNPVAYLYSIHIDLANLEGREVSLLVAPRPNNHFAFPAYYVLDVE